MSEPVAVTLTPSLAEVQRVREVVGAAFATDPMFEWLFHEPAGRADATAAWIGLFVEAFALGGTVDVVRGADGKIVGAALWRLDGDDMPFPAAPSVGGLLVAVIVAILTAGYMAPWAIAAVRDVPHWSVFWVNLLLGWTIVGWIIALVMALRAQRLVITG